jgi:hypothetical protein
VTVSTTGNTCFEGEVVTLSAVVTTPVAAIESADISYTWSLVSGDTAPFDNQGTRVLYTCSVVGDHAVTLVIDTVNGTPYPIKPVTVVTTITVNNAALNLGVVSLETTAVPGTAVSEAFVMEEMTLIVQFSDASKDNKHELTVQWGDGSTTTTTELALVDAVKSILADKWFLVTHLYSVAKKNTVSISVTDNAGSTKTATKTLMTSLAASANCLNNAHILLQ